MTQNQPAQGCIPLRIVVIGTSLGDESDTVVRAGLGVARAAGARVFLVHAAPAEPLVDFELGFGAEAQQQISWREEKLRQQRQRLGIGDAELAGMAVHVGAAHRVLIQAARSEQADLIVVGATGSGPLSAELLGSNADRVLRKAARPVLVVRGELLVSPRLVLSLFYFSPLAGEALRCGLQILAAIAGGSPVAVRVVHVLSVMDVLAHRPDGMKELGFEAERQRYSEELPRFVEQYRADGPFEVETAVLGGESRFEILHDLERHPADLALLCSHGRGGFDRLMLGSVAATVTRKAPCSVLLLPPAAAGDPPREDSAG